MNIDYMTIENIITDAGEFCDKMNLFLYETRALNYKIGVAKNTLLSLKQILEKMSLAEFDILQPYCLGHLGTKYYQRFSEASDQTALVKLLGEINANEVAYKESVLPMRFIFDVLKEINGYHYEVFNYGDSKFFEYAALKKTAVLETLINHCAGLLEQKKSYRNQCQQQLKFLLEKKRALVSQEVLLNRSLRELSNILFYKDDLVVKKEINRVFLLKKQMNVLLIEKNYLSHLKTTVNQEISDTGNDIEAIADWQRRASHVLCSLKELEKAFEVMAGKRQEDDCRNFHPRGLINYVKGVKMFLDSFGSHLEYLAFIKTSIQRKVDKLTLQTDPCEKKEVMVTEKCNQDGQTSSVSLVVEQKRKSLRRKRLAHVMSANDYYRQQEKIKQAKMRVCQEQDKQVPTKWSFWDFFQWILNYIVECLKKLNHPTQKYSSPIIISGIFAVSAQDDRLVYAETDLSLSATYVRDMRK
jgi:hypothetical protein